MIRQPRRWTGLLPLMMAFALALTFQGCGGGGGTSSYSSPSTTSTGAVVDPATVKSWIDSGKVNGTGYDRVVILDVSSQADYNTGHIPDAQWLNPGNLYENRDEGVLTDINMVLDGPTMDALVQKYGIDGNTTIVFTSADDTVNQKTGAENYFPWLSVGRAYWTFRYWGFPKDRLKVLNGLDAAYDNTYGLTANGTPPITPSTWSVKDNPSFRGDLRSSLMDMINFADGKDYNTVVLDTRGEDGDGYDKTSSYSGDKHSTPGAWDPAHTSVAFEGHINGAKALNTYFFYKVVKGTPKSYMALHSASAMAKMLAENGVNSTQKIIVHCRTGVIAAGAFVAIDAVLGWNVANYDGSWTQWGMLASTANCGPLDPSSPWRTDTPQRTQNLTFNEVAVGNCTGIEDATDGGTYPVDSFDTDLNRINEQDSAYFSSGSSSGSSSSGGGASLGCGS